MSVIRHPVAEQVVRDAIGLRLDDIAKQAASLLASAEQQALATVQTATEERRCLIENAHKEGFTTGFDLGKEEGLSLGREEGFAAAVAESSERIDTICVKWNAAISDIEHHREMMFSKARQDLVAFAVELASRIVHRTVEHNPEVMAGVLDDAIRHVMLPATLVIRTDPASATVLSRVSTELGRRFGTESAVRVEVDELLPAGSCVVSSSHGTQVDSSVQTQLDRLVDVILPDRGAVNPPNGNING